MTTAISRLRSLAVNLGEPLTQQTDPDLYDYFRARSRDAEIGRELPVDVSIGHIATTKTHFGRWHYLKTQLAVLNEAAIMMPSGEEEGSQVGIVEITTVEKSRHASRAGSRLISFHYGVYADAIHLLGYDVNLQDANAQLENSVHSTIRALGLYAVEEHVAREVDDYGLPAPAYGALGEVDALQSEALAGFVAEQHAKEQL